MPADANGALQASVTKTSSFNGAAMDLKSGTPRRGIYARILYSAATNASGSNSVTFSIENSPDNSNWYRRTDGAEQVIALSTTAQAGEIVLPIETSDRYIRLVATIAGAGSTPTVTYEGAIVAGRP